MTPRSAVMKDCWQCGAIRLTHTQMAIWRLMADERDLSFGEIGQEISRTASTTKNMASTLYAILGVKGRPAAVRKFHERPPVESS